MGESALSFQIGISTKKVIATLFDIPCVQFPLVR